MLCRGSKDRMGGTTGEGERHTRRTPTTRAVWSKGRIWSSEASSCEGEAEGGLEGGSQGEGNHGAPSGSSQLKRKVKRNTNSNRAAGWRPDNGEWSWCDCGWGLAPTGVGLVSRSPGSSELLRECVLGLVYGFMAG